MFLIFIIKGSIYFVIFFFSSSITTFRLLFSYYRNIATKLCTMYPVLCLSCKLVFYTENLKKIKIVDIDLINT